MKLVHNLYVYCTLYVDRLFIMHVFQVWATWEGFLFGLQEASDFVEVHKPQVSEKLLETISVRICLIVV